MDLVFHENELYIAIDDHGISKINISDSSHILTDIITDINVISMDFFNDELYFEAGSELKKLETINEATTAKTIFVATSAAGIAPIKFKGNELYFVRRKFFGSLGYRDIIRKLNMSTLSIENVDHISLPTITLSPNPSSKEIVIHNLKEEEKNDFKIFNTVGKLILQGEISNCEKINIENFNQGTYFIKIGNKYNLKFIKK